MNHTAQRTAIAVTLVTTALLLLTAPTFAADGELDRSFSDDGKQTTNLGGNEFAEGVAIQPNGKIVVLAEGPSPGYQLIRYNPDGSLDPTFLANRIVSDGLFGGDLSRGEIATGLAVQGGKVVVVGSIGTFAKPTFAVTRFTRNGSRDNSFSGDGTQTISFGRRSALGSEASAVAIDDQRRIVVLGTADIEGFPTFALARLAPGGALDRSFSRDGKRLTSFRGCDEAESVAVTRNGGVVVVGNVDFCQAVSAPAWGIARYRPSGRLDRSFSRNGKRLDFRRVDHGAAVGVAVRNGRIVAVGTKNGHFALARYRRDGTLDRSFSGDGHQVTGVHPKFGDIPTDMAIQRDGRIVVTGRSYLEPGDRRRNRGPEPRGTFALARYLDNGRLDRSLSGDGKRTLRFGARGPDASNGMAIQKNGAIVVAGVDRESMRSIFPGLLFPRADRPRRLEDIAVARFKG
jgi:uncharacterized delta-60 repeat protein